MALNPFFLQGSPNEQRLIQELINEQLKIYGVEVIYIPRKFVRKQTIIKEIQSSRFDDNYAIEAYVNSYDGYLGQGDILSKFGVSLKDEVSLVISRERYEDFISPFLDENDPEIELSSRPREGDLVYFPLGQRLFEVKFVEHEQPFYQLGKLYVYELKCELFEYEDEIIDTTINEIDEQIQDEGYITTLKLSSFGGVQAYAIAGIGTGYVDEIFLNNDGYGYTSIPTISISAPPLGGVRASAVAITSSYGSFKSIKDILIVNPGSGYTVAPKITISGGGGVGAAATCSIQKFVRGITNITMVDEGSGYLTNPNISFPPPSLNVSVAKTAVGIASLSPDGKVKTILLSNSGVGYTTPINIYADLPPIPPNPGLTTTNINYKFNEIVVGSLSGTRARVKSWNLENKILKLSIISDSSKKGFYPGESIVGSASSTAYIVETFNSFDNDDKYSQNKTIETEADQIIDFSESNPFGIY